MWGYAVFYIGALQLIMMALVTYNTTLRDWVWQYLGIHLELWQFIVGLVVIILFGFVSEYILSVPALIAVANEQMYAHQNPIKADFEEVKAGLDEVKAELGKVKKELQELKEMLK